MKSRLGFTARYIVIIATLAFWGTRVSAQSVTSWPRQIAVDEDVLAAFVDEPCRHFENARTHLVAGRHLLAARHLRTASAFLRLEAARANQPNQKKLNSSIHELHELAKVVEGGHLSSVDKLGAAFARAHVALADHHCTMSAHRCCQLTTFGSRQDAMRAGQDLRAATTNLSHASSWAEVELDAETQETIQATELRGTISCKK